jgi:ABC-type branched-subunit amino acid transport system ATPase component
MIKDIEIYNYKIFENLKLQGFNQINLIGGLNNTGKTSLLEAIFNAYDRLSWDIFLKPQVWRSGIPLVNMTQGIWTPIFHNYEQTREISIKLSTGDNEFLELSLHKEKLSIPTSQSVVNDGIFPYSGNQGINGKEALRLLFKRGNHIIQETFLYIEDNQIKALNKKLQEKTSTLVQYLSSKTISSVKEAVAYGEILKVNMEDAALKALQIIEPVLKSIIPVPEAEGITVLYGDIGFKSKIPLYNMGDGISRMLAYINAMVKCRNGIVLFDEIENGFHYTVHRKIWQIFLQLALQLNVQIFATTHSLEMVQAFNEVSRNNPDVPFSYIELFRNQANNRISGNIMDSESLMYKLKTGKPFRGE